jgi:hypothetical protein
VGALFSGLLRFARNDGSVLPRRADRASAASGGGAKSQLFHAEDAAYFLSSSRLVSPHVEIPEAEHHVMIDQPLAFAAAPRALLAAWP